MIPDAAWGRALVEGEAWVEVLPTGDVRSVFPREEGMRGGRVVPVVLDRLEGALRDARTGAFLGRIPAAEVETVIVLRQAAENYLAAFGDVAEAAPRTVTVWRLVIQTGAGGTLVRQYDDKDTAQEQALEWLADGHAVLELKPVQVAA